MRTKIVVIAFLLMFSISCNFENRKTENKVETNKTSIKIIPYNGNDRGKFWEICIDYKYRNSSDAIAYFEICDKNNFTKEYEVKFIHLKEKCNKKNVLVTFIRRHTPHEEFEWLKNLESDSVKYIKVTVKKKWDASEIEIADTLYSKDLIY